MAIIFLVQKRATFNIALLMNFYIFLLRNEKKREDRIKVYLIYIAGVSRLFVFHFCSKTIGCPTFIKIPCNVKLCAGDIWECKRGKRKFLIYQILQFRVYFLSTKNNIIACEKRNFICKKCEDIDSVKTLSTNLFLNFN